MSIYVREQDRLEERIRKLEQENKSLNGELKTVKLRLAQLENERQPSGRQTEEPGPAAVRKRKKASTASV